MVLEDYTGPVELPLFSDDYLKFKQYIETGYFLYIKARIQSRFNDPNNLEIKVGSIKMLPDVGNDFAKSITLSLNLEDIDSDIVISLNKILGNHPGKLPVRFAVKDDIHRVELASKKVRVSFSKDLFEELEYRQGIKFRINS